MMHSKQDNIEIMINDEADEVIKELFYSLKNRYRNYLEKMTGSEPFFMLIYCIINAIELIQIFVNHIKILLIGKKNKKPTINLIRMHHFADDTNLLIFNSCVKSINKQVNYDVKNLSNWLKANKI